MNEPTCITTRGILFDMDGVLISSISSVNRSWRQWAKIYGVPDADNYQAPHGVRAIEIIRSLRPDIDPYEGLRVAEEIEVADNDGLKVLPGALELLSSLPKERWSIVTSATRRLVLSRLEVVGLPIPDRLITADMVERGKPDPEPYRRGAELLGLRPDECIVIEDAPSGISAGLAAGSRVLSVLGTHTAAELHAATWRTLSLVDVRAATNPLSIELCFTPAQ